MDDQQTPESRPAAIKLERLKKAYGKIEALKGVDLRIEAGELFAYLGPNGAGKTTTIRILTGLTRLTGGRACLNGYDIEKEALEAKRQCGLAPQHLNLDGELTVYENMDIHARLFGMASAERKKKISELLAYVDLDGRLDSLVKTLSGGLKRRLLIARALVHNPGILFLDEPTVGLDADIRRRVWALIKKIKQNGTTVFLTTHYIEEAEFLADRVAFLDEGRIAAIDAPAALMNRVGGWAVDRLDAEGMQTEYFHHRDDARKFAAGQDAEFTLRRANLEDVFLSLTGKKVQ